MSLTVHQGGGSYELVPEGVHVGICCQVVDLGPQRQTWEGKEKIVDQVLIAWEFPGALMSDGRPFMRSQTYTASLHERAKLRKHLESWRGRAFTDDELSGFSLRALLGKACLVQVIHAAGSDGKTYANIAAVMSLPKGTTVPPGVNPQVWYDLSEPDPSAFSMLPEWVQKKIEARVIAPPPADVPPAVDLSDDDLPF